MVDTSVVRKGAAVYFLEVVGVRIRMSRQCAGCGRELETMKNDASE